MLQPQSNRSNRHAIQAPRQQGPDLSSTPPDLEIEAVMRFRDTALATAVLGIVAVVIAPFYKWWPMELDACNYTMALGAAGALVSIAARQVVMRNLVGRDGIRRVIVTYVVAIGVLVALWNNHRAWPSGDLLPGFSLLSIWIIAGLIAMPRPWIWAEALVGGLAVIDPISIVILEAVGAVQSVPMMQIGQRFSGTVLAAMLGYLVCVLSKQYNSKLSRARDMGSYELLEEIGRGAMGAVYKARHRLLATPAAVKFISMKHAPVAGASESHVVIRRFEREAKTTARLRSPHTVRVFDFGRNDQGELFYVMELVDGFDLGGFVRRFGAVTPERAVYFMAQVCHSLHEAHRAHLIHRDIKPSNILIGRGVMDDDLIKVVDFGLVFTLPNVQDATDLTGTVGLVGTPGFIAPELSLGRKQLGPRADIYSVGCVLYWLLTGRRVFEGDNPVAIFARHLTERPVPPSSLCDKPIPPQLDALVLRCLSKNPEDRPVNAWTLREELTRIHFETPWNEERAAQWWAQHVPDVPEKPTTTSDMKVVPEGTT